MQWWQPFHRFLTPKRLSYPLIAGAALWLVWLISISFGGGTFDLAHQVIGTDYIQFYAAGNTILAGDGAQLYDFEYQKQLQTSITGQQVDSLHAFITPPFLAWLYLPFALLPYLPSFLLWSAFSLAILYLSFIWLGLDRPALKYLYALSFFPVFASISFGQNSLLSLGLLSLSYFLWQKDNKLYAGLAASLLLYKPQLILGVGLLWLLSWRRDWKSLLGLSLGGALLYLLSCNFLPQAHAEYQLLSRNLFPLLMEFEGFPIWHAHNVRAFILLLFPGLTSLSYIVWGLISLLGIFGFFRIWKNYREMKPIMFAAAICLTVLITPHAMIYDWVLLLIPAVLLWVYKPNLRQFLVAIFALIWIVTIISGSLTNLQLGWFSRAVQISIPVYLYLLVIMNKYIFHTDPIPDEI